MVGLSSLLRTSLIEIRVLARLHSYPVTLGKNMLPSSLAVSRIHFIVVVGLRCPLSCQLSAWYHSQLLEAALRSLPCATSHLGTEKLP